MGSREYIEQIHSPSRKLTFDPLDSVDPDDYF